MPRKLPLAISTNQPINDSDEAKNQNIERPLYFRIIDDYLSTILVARRRTPQA
jgi:hypothetical protein